MIFVIWRQFQGQRNYFPDLSNFSQIRNQKQFVARIKEIIITAGGENVAPTNIEEEIKSELPEVWRTDIHEI